MARHYYEDLAVVWAYEVDPMKLGSHLEAYNVCRLLFQTLRLCHNYRKSAPVTGLLVEGLKIIEDEIIEAHVAELGCAPTHGVGRVTRPMGGLEGLGTRGWVPSRL
jgi:hypothetical protein